MQISSQQDTTRHKAVPHKPVSIAATTSNGINSSSSQGSATRATTPHLLQLIGGIITQGLKFGVVSGGVFLGLNAIFYHLYGQLFLQEAFLHHLTRKDPRHNFSIYFYHVYLTFMDWTQGIGAGPSSASVAAEAAAVAGRGAAAMGWPEVVSRVVGSGGSGAMGSLLIDPNSFAFLFQWMLLLVLAVALHRHLPFCWLIQTMAFVAFNKVSRDRGGLWLGGDTRGRHCPSTETAHGTTQSPFVDGFPRRSNILQTCVPMCRWCSL